MFLQAFALSTENIEGTAHLSIACGAKNKAAASMYQKIHGAAAFAYATPSQIA